MTETSAGSAFERDVLAVLRSLRKGDVVTYGEVALEAGYPGRSRAVGALLASGAHRVPWWRVVNASGRLVPGNEVAQAEHLRKEGVAVDLAAKRVSRRAVSASSATTDPRTHQSRGTRRPRSAGSP